MSLIDEKARAIVLVDELIYACLTADRVPNEIRELATMAGRHFPYPSDREVFTETIIAEIRKASGRGGEGGE